MRIEQMDRSDQGFLSLERHQSAEAADMRGGEAIACFPMIKLGQFIQQGIVAADYADGRFQQIRLLEQLDIDQTAGLQAFAILIDRQEAVRPQKAVEHSGTALHGNALPLIFDPAQSDANKFLVF